MNRRRGRQWLLCGAIAAAVLVEACAKGASSADWTFGPTLTPASPAASTAASAAPSAGPASSAGASTPVGTAGPQTSSAPRPSGS